MKLLALVICALAGVGCGMRTGLSSSVDAHVVTPDAPVGRDTPPDHLVLPDVVPDHPNDPPLRDLRPVDLPVEVLVDVKPPLPDLLPDRGPDRFPDLVPDLRSDLPRDVRPDLLPDLLRDVRPDLLPDLLRDVPPDLPPDVPPDLAGDRYPGDLSSELPSQQGDALCALGSTEPCECDNGLLGSRICLPNLIYSECGCGTSALMRVKNGIIGTWTGTATTPWVPTYHVTFTFDSYSHYSSKALDGRGEPALYYGTDDDLASKRYDINDIQANGDATGTIDICFDSNDCNRNSLQGIQLSADLSRLKFYFAYLGTYGPLEYDLQRTLR